jgi:hypothetical protein
MVYVFSNQKYQFGFRLEGLSKENVGIFYGHLVYLIAIWYILWPFGTFCGHLIHFVVIWYMFSRLGMLCQKNLATLNCKVNKREKNIVLICYVESAKNALPLKNLLKAKSRRVNIPRKRSLCQITTFYV